MIEFQHVFKSYGRGRNILADINFRVSAGEFIFVSGPSGAGKSTLLKLIGGLEPASRGSIQVNGQRLDKLARARPICGAPSASSCRTPICCSTAARSKT